MAIDFRKFFSGKRHVVTFAAIAVLLIVIAVNDYLPIGPGNWNEHEIKRIGQNAPSDKFSFAVLADNKNGYKTFGRILKDIEENNYLFAIDVGDLVYDGEKAKYRIFYNLIDNLKTPFLAAPGNHDIRETGEGNYFDIFGKFYYSFAYDNSLFIILDDANETAIDAVQMQWLEGELQKNYKHKFVFLHVPPFDPRPDSWHALQDRANGEKFMALMEKYKPDTVFTSHIHAYYNVEKNGVDYVVTGGAGGELLTDDPDHSFYHYIKVDVDGDKVDKTVIRFPSPTTNYFGRLAYDAWLYFNAFWVTHKYGTILFLVILILLVDFSAGGLVGLIKNLARRK
jgi:hypothetical protein